MARELGHTMARFSGGDGRRRSLPAFSRVLSLVLIPVALSLAFSFLPRALATAGSNQDDSGQLQLSLESIRQGKYEAAESLLAGYLKQHPDSWQAYSQLGFVYFRKHDARRSVEALRRSLRENPEQAEAHKIVAFDFAMIGRYDLAREELLEAVRLRPDSAEIHYFLGRSYYSVGTYLLAQQEFEEAIRLDPTYVKAYDNLGLAMEALGKNSAAVEKYQRAAELSQEQGLNDAWPYVNLACHYNDDRQPDLALVYAQKAVAVNPTIAQAYFEMGRAYRMREEWQQAARALEQAINRDQRHERSYYVLSFVYRKLGKVKESQDAMASFTRLHQLSTDMNSQRELDSQ
jgi:superkiller protein 3